MDIKNIESLIPGWVWLFFFGERSVSMDGYTLEIINVNLLWRHTQRIDVGTPEWFVWIEENDSFVFCGKETRCLFRKEEHGKYQYWYIYKWNHYIRKNIRLYIGSIAKLTPSEIVSRTNKADYLSQLDQEGFKRLYRRKLRLSRRKRPKADKPKPNGFGFS